ncbi:MAG: aspartyl/glutamyl-tRNA amidotransferase subunit C [Proteobacteria bacterium]|nr:aspartyl/glutamyl-tRNA amidotransferase subunit C [Cystobacterineae bacterium]MCL2259453.1 aspartyl/glutamyl-tRNA amidotransferase subunit C [Cystobacterineae bacterium]MCL2314101.1 aspartyl/glutamyl-tRNA amidotransferase subunit C [Pseudomonadota bacterium]
MHCILREAAKQQKGSQGRNMKFSSEEFKTIVQTAIHNTHVAMSEEEFLACQQGMAFVVNWAEEMDKLPLEGVKITVNVNFPENCPTRPDVVTPSMGIEKALSQAPAKLGSCFIVPQIISE